MSCFNFEYYLNDVQIFEPFNFDGANIKIEQKENSFARDVYLFNEGVELSFYKNEFTGGLTHGFDLITSAINEKGADADISFSIKNNGVSYFLGRLDLENMITDGVNFVKVKTIDEGGRFLFKRDFETKKKITRTPLKVLLKANPVEQVSEWKQSSLINFYYVTYGKDGYLFAPANNQTKYDIKNSYIPLEQNRYIPPLSDSNTINDLAENNRIIIANTTLENVRIIVKVKELTAVTNNGFTTNKELAISHGTHFVDDKTVYILEDSSNYTNDNILVQNKTYDITIPLITQGQKVWFYLTCFQPYGLPAATPIGSDTVVLDEIEIKIIATSTAINSVVEAHRWVDLMKDTSNLPVTAPDFDANGEFNNTVLTNGYGIRSIRGKDFTTTTKDVYDIDFLAMDYQVNNNSVEVAKFEDFYPDEEMVDIPELYAENIQISPNSRFRITDLKFGFKKYEQDRDEQNTLDSVHTYSEWKAPNKFTQGKFERTTNIIFDPYKIESTRRLGFEDRTKNSSLSEDDDLFGIDIVPIGNENVQTYKGIFAQLTSGTTLQLLTNSFNWYSTGIEAGNTITITGSNAGTYTVTEINNIGNIIKLSGTNNGVSIEEILTITYPLTGVLYKSRTSEGFASITGVANPTNYGNLLYQQKRIINRWNNYLGTVTKYYQSEALKQTFFKNNKNLIVDGYNDAIDFTPTGYTLNENVVKLEAKCSFENAMVIAQKLVTRNANNTIGGYVVIDNVAGYIRDFEYSFGTGMLSLTLELKEIGYLISQSDEYILSQTGDNIQLQ